MTYIAEYHFTIVATKPELLKFQAVGKRINSMLEFHGGYSNTLFWQAKWNRDIVGVNPDIRVYEIRICIPAGFWFNFLPLFPKGRGHGVADVMDTLILDKSSCLVVHSWLSEFSDSDDDEGFAPFVSRLF